jgi:hypothetical protein
MKKTTEEKKPLKAWVLTTPSPTKGQAIFFKSRKEARDFKIEAESRDQVLNGPFKGSFRDAE